MVLMATASDHAIVKPSPPVSSSLSPPAAFSRSRLHSFSFPTLSWGSHRLLRCSKNASTSSPPPPPQTPSPDKEKPHDSPSAAASLPQRPWNLRTRRSATAAPGLDNSAPAPAQPPPSAEDKKRAFSIVLSKEEIAEDFIAIRGARPPRRPRKRPRAVQRQVDLVYPGLCLADVTPDSYKIEER